MEARHYFRRVSPGRPVVSLRAREAFPIVPPHQSEQTEAEIAAMSERDNAQKPAGDALETSFSGRTLRPGDIVTGTIVKITGSVAFVDFGARTQGYIQLAELRDAEGELTFTDGDELTAEVMSTRSGIELSYRRARDTQVIERLREAWKTQAPVEGRIVAVNKGGFEIRVEGIRAFCPSSQLADRFIQEPAREVGKSYDFRITEFGEGKSLVLSRRAVLEERRTHAREVLDERIRVGERLQGKVTQLTNFGAFVDLGEGVLGMIHVSEISRERVNHPQDKLSVGDAVEVEVIRVEAEKGRVALSMRALESDPFGDFVANLKIGQAVTGTIDRLQPFGAFVKLAPGVDGLVHVSGISATERVEDPADKFAVGDEVALVVEKIDRDRQRIGLVTPEVFEARKPVEIPFKVGDVVTGKVTRHEQYGVFVELAERIVGLCLLGESATERNADLRRVLPVGMDIEVKVVEVDRERGRVRVSRKAVLQGDDERSMSDYRKKQKEEVPQSLGTFGDLLKNFLKK